MKIQLCQRILHIILKFSEILALGLIYHLMIPKKCEKRTIKSRACVPLRNLFPVSFIELLRNNSTKNASIVISLTYPHIFINRELT
jgi:hypothetical protein